MVERDRFEKQFGAGWRSAYQYAREGQVPLGEIADKLVGSLAKTLRELGGMPAFPDMARILVQGKELGILSAFGSLDDFAERQDGHRHTWIVAEEAKSLYFQLEAAGWGIDATEIPVRLAEASCLALVERYYFAKARQPLLAEGRFANYEECAKWQGQIEALIRPQLSKMATKLATNPDGTGLRAPSRLTKKERTSDLLAESIPGMHPSGQPINARPR